MCHAVLCHVLGWWRVTSPAPRMLFGVRLSRGEGPRLAFSGCRQANSLKCLKDYSYYVHVVGARLLAREAVAH